MTDPSTLTLIVPGEVAVGDAERKPEDFEEHAIPVIGRLFHGSKEVDIGKLQASLEKAQDQIDALLKKVRKSTVSGYRLSSIEVSLAISAEGSIGVASAGVEASLSLSFERTE